MTASRHPPRRTPIWRLGALGALLCLLPPAAGCAAGAPAPETAPGTADPTAARPATTTEDTTAANLVPAGFGSLRQDDIALRLQAPGLQIKATPLDESVIRTLSPDSYRALRDLQDSKRAEIAAAARRLGLQEYRLWYVSFFGIEQQARFSPRELTIASLGRDFRPLEVLPLTAGFGEQRLQQRQVQSAIYLFDGALDPDQPLTVIYGDAQNAGWQQVLRTIERERSLIRSRAMQGRP